MPRPISHNTKIGEYRDRYAVSVVTLAKRSGVSVSTIKKIEAGYFDLTIETAQKLGRGLEIHWCRLFTTRELLTLSAPLQQIVDFLSHD